ncbi:MAG: hypothetical protein Ta2E_04680 [Mycoplasmoidaceae bacterium]|nr:MAG: hypothetical protein Ta2E_04680 [Mycoplasmoidaceae bacterium]
MGSRLEKFKSERVQIRNKGILLPQIEKENQLINSYKKRIDNISPNILDGISNSTEYAPFLYFDNSDHKDEKKLSQLSIGLNVYQLNGLRLKISDLYEENKCMVDNYVFKSNGQFNEAWLYKYGESEALVKIRKIYEKVRPNIKYDITNELENLQNTNDKFKTKMLDKYKGSPKTKSIKWLYFSSIALVIIFVIIVVLMTVLKVETNLL